MLFLNKRVAVSPSSAFSSPTRVNKSQVQNNIKTLTEEIETNYENTVFQRPTFQEVLAQAAEYTAQKGGQHNEGNPFCNTLNILTLNKPVNWQSYSLFLAKVASDILNSQMNPEDKKKFFQGIFNVNYRQNVCLEDSQNFESILGGSNISEGIFRFIHFIRSEIRVSEEKANKFLKYMADFNTKKEGFPTILGFLGSSQLCPVQVKELEACAGVILKQEPQDEESCASGYTLYVFDDTLKASIEEEIASQSEAPQRQEPVFDLGLLRELCCSFANEAIKNEVEVTVLAEVVGTPRPSYSLTTPARHTDHNTTSTIMYSGAKPMLRLPDSVGKRLASTPSTARILFNEASLPVQEWDQRVQTPDGTEYDIPSSQGSDSDVIQRPDIGVIHDLAGRSKQQSFALKNPESRAGSAPFSPAGPMGASTAFAGRSFTSATDSTPTDEKWENCKLGRSGVEEGSHIRSKSPGKSGKLDPNLLSPWTKVQVGTPPAHGKAT